LIQGQANAAKELKDKEEREVEAAAAQLQRELEEASLAKCAFEQVCDLAGSKLNQG
jgi:hypothetical protein